MNKIYRKMLFFGLLFAIFTALNLSANAQNKNIFEVFSGEALKKIVPTSFYFAGQSAETQMRNASAATIGKDRHIIAGMVDTSGYSTEISGKYEGFFITDSPVKFGTKMLPTGAYGFGFAANGQVKIFDLSSKELLSTATKADGEMKRPRPLQMISDTNGIRFYKGKNYVLISPK